MSITFPTTNLKVPNGFTALPSGLKRPAFGTLYGFDAPQGGGGSSPVIDLALLAENNDFLMTENNDNLEFEE
jgi:hypothetical protein